jgi:hypothetical protein
MLLLFLSPGASRENHIRRSAKATATQADICTGALTRQRGLPKNLRCNWNHMHPPIGGHDYHHIERKDAPLSGVDEGGDWQYVLSLGLQRHALVPRPRRPLPHFLFPRPSRPIHKCLPHGPHHRSLQRPDRRWESRRHQHWHECPV